VPSQPFGGLRDPRNSNPRCNPIKISLVISDMKTLTHEFAAARRLRHQIMRRVWYAFMMSVCFRPALGLGFLFGASAIALWQLVSIISIVENFLAVGITNTPAFVANALLLADTAALMALLTFVTAGTFALVRVLKYSFLDLATFRVTAS